MSDTTTKRGLDDAAAGRRRGWAVTLWLLPSLALGTWLLVVPDHVTFRLNQAATLAHVALALALMPAGLWWLWAHARALPARRGGRPAAAARLGLAALVTAACATGLAALYTGRVGAVAALHAACGLAVALPLAAHVALAGRRRAAALLAALVPAAALGAWMTSRAVPPLPVAPETPAFAFRTRDASLYEPAEWCGGCHEDVFREWADSLHARTFELPRVREDLARFTALHRLDLRDFGAVERGSSPTPVMADGHAVRGIESCVHCHAPASFYGDDPSDPVGAPSPASADAVGCAYCHTLRAVRRGGAPPERFARRLRAEGEAAYARGLGPITEREFGAMMSLAVSAPETVRPYLGQRGGPLGRAVASWLIRWRPAMHRNDYRPAVLATSEACSVCHGITEELWTAPHQEYPTWARSHFARRPEAERVDCQDCHMAERMTGAPTREPGRVTPWSPVRPARRSHRFLGGNARAFDALGDPAMARREHALNLDAVRLRVVALRREGDRLLARVEARNHHTGHVFPASEDGFRPAWVGLRARSADGATLAATPPPRRGGTPAPNVIVRVVDRDQNRVVHDSTLLPGAARTFEVALDLPPGTALASVDVEAWHMFDGEPIARVRAPALPLSAPPAPSERSGSP